MNKSRLLFASKMSSQFGVKGVALVKKTDGSEGILPLAIAKAFALTIIKTADTVKELTEK